MKLVLMFKINCYVSFSLCMTILPWVFFRTTCWRKSITTYTNQCSLTFLPKHLLTKLRILSWPSWTKEGKVILGFSFMNYFHTVMDANLWCELYQLVCTILSVSIFRYVTNNKETTILKFGLLRLFSFR